MADSLPQRDAGGDRSRRLPLIDALRGVLLLAMASYHFSWDLANVRLVSLGRRQRSAVARLRRRAIAGSFLLCCPAFPFVFPSAAGSIRSATAPASSASCSPPQPYRSGPTSFFPRCLGLLRHPAHDAAGQPPGAAARSPTQRAAGPSCGGNPRPAPSLAIACPRRHRLGISRPRRDTTGRQRSGTPVPVRSRPTSSASCVGGPLARHRHGTGLAATAPDALARFARSAFPAVLSSAPAVALWPGLGPRLRHPRRSGGPAGKLRL